MYVYKLSVLVLNQPTLSRYVSIFTTIDLKGAILESTTCYFRLWDIDHACNKEDFPT